MSDQEKNTGRTDDMDFSALDAELAKMAEETPEVPEDFHENWTRMIREEAAAGRPAAAAKPRKGRGQLRYILSAAAAFVILVGGVVIARNNGLLQGRTSAPEPPVTASNMLMVADTVQEAAESVYDEADTVQEAAESVYDEAEAAAEQAGFPAMSADSMPAPEAGLLSAKAAEGVQNSGPAVPMPAATAEPTALPVLMMGSAAVETNEAAETETAGSSPADMAAGDAETEETASAEKAAEGPDAETAEGSAKEDARSFLQRAWEGLLDAVPWILGGAIIVLFILTRVIRPENKK